MRNQDQHDHLLNRYLTLFNHMEQGFCIIEILFDSTGKAADYRFLEVNPAFEKQTGLQKATGKTISELRPGIAVSWLKRYDKIIKTGKTVHFEKQAGHPAGSVWYEVYAVPLAPPESRQVAIFYNDITQRKKAEEALRINAGRQAFLLKLSDALRPLGDPAIIAETACRLLVENLDASRAQYTQIEGAPGAETGQVCGEYIRRGSPMTRRFPLAPFGESIIARLRGGEIFVLTDAQYDPELSDSQRAAFLAVDSPSAVCIPLVKLGRFVAAFTVHDNQPRHWTAEEITLIGDIAERTWSAVERSLAQKALKENRGLINGQKEAFQAAMSGQPLAASLEVLIRTVYDQTGGEARAAFYVMPADGAGLHLVAGMSAAYAKDVNGFKVGPESLACGLAMHTGEPVITRDIEEEPRWEPFRSLARNHGYRGCWSFPVRTAGGPVLGTFAIYFSQPRQPEPRELELAGVVAHAAAIIISRHMELQERTQAERALRDSEQQLKKLLQVREEFISIASHELKTPLTTIRVLAELVEEQLQEEGETSKAEMITKLNVQVDRLVRLINDLLDTTRIEEGRIVYNRERIVLNELITERVEEVQRSRPKRKITFQLDRPATITGDRERLAQVLVNLVSNAIKYSAEDTEIKVRTMVQQDEVMISVIDSGIGIPAASIDKIFERFYRVGGDARNTYPGMGLGLYISSEIVKNHGGTISVSSKEGEGSEFTVRLPLK